MVQLFYVVIGVIFALLCAAAFIIPRLRRMQKDISELKKFALIVESCPLSIIFKNTDTGKFYANAATKALLEDTDSALLGIDKIFSDEDLKTFNDPNARVASETGAWNRITSFLNHSAKKVDVFQCVFALDNPGEAGKNICIITRRVYEEKKLRQIADIQSTIVDSSDNFVVAMNRSFEVIYSNPAAYEMSGYSPEEIGMNITPELVHDKETAKRIRRNMVRALEGGFCQDESVLIRKDGKKLDVEYQIFPILDQDEHIFGVCVILRDISQRKESERQLFRMSTLVNSSPQYIAYVNNKGQFDFCNNATHDITGYTFEELKAGGIKILYSDETNKRIEDEILPNIFSLGKYEFEIPLIRKDGEERIMSFSGFRLDNDDYGCGTIASDVTEKKNLENELIKAKEVAEAASDAKSQFLSRMSHEIRTPMNAIMGMAELLMSENLNTRQKEYVGDIKTSSTALLSIINEILDFSRIEAGKLQLAPISYDLHELLFNLESMFKLIANQKGVEFILEMDESLPKYVFGDDIRLRQIFVNNLGNAIKFTRAGYVKFKAWRDGDSLFFDVIDTGIGIKADDLPKIFNDFERLDTSNTRRLGGTGLGLAITKSLLEMMGGKISIESSYGKGSVFHIEIPYVCGDEASIADPTKEEIYICAPEAKILVVDDNEINLNVAAGLLRLFDIECDTALSGKIAIEKIAENKYDIVFMDHMMPEMNGIDATRILRKTYDEQELVIVALTANAIEGIRGTFIDAGMNDYLSKPIDKHLLSRILYRWLPEEKICRKPSSIPPSGGKKRSKLLERIREKCEELDLSLALSRVNGMNDVLEQSLLIMSRRLPDVCDRLFGFLHDGDLRGFAIEVHGAKGSLNNVGATELAKLAEVLELKAKADDAGFCQQHLPEFLTKLQALYQKLEPIINAKSGKPLSKANGNEKELKSKLKTVRRLLDNFECDEAEQILGNLVKFDYGKPINGRLHEILAMTSEFEYEKAIELINTYIGPETYDEEEQP